jgi:methyl coenzyme M reductase subunit C-like uncharacterized protein (methanogenesis marker protein 7)
MNVKAKVEKEHPTFVDLVAGLSVSQLEDHIVKMTKDLERNEKEKEENQKLKEVAELKKELMEPYAFIKKATQLKLRYIVDLIEEKGGDVSGTR